MFNENVYPNTAASSSLSILKLKSLNLFYHRDTYVHNILFELMDLQLNLGKFTYQEKNMYLLVPII